MKRFVFFLGMLLGVAASAQEGDAPATQPPQPGTESRPQPSFLGQPGFTNSSAVIGGFTNAFGAGTVTNQFTNQFGNITLGTLSSTLFGLQAEIEQVLPLLFSITSGAELSGFPTSTIPPAASPPPSQSGANFGVSFGVNAGQNFAVNATRPSTPPAGTTPLTGVTSALGGTFLSPTGTTNAFVRPGFGTTGGTTNALSPEAMQLVAILQNDLQRALPVLAMLNGALAGGAAGAGFPTPTNTLSGNFANPLTNTFANPLTNQSRFLAPGPPRPQ